MPKNLVKKYSEFQQVVLPVFSFYIIIHIFNRIVFSIGNTGLNIIYLLPDISVQIFLAYILYKCSKRYSIFLLIQFTLMSWFYIGSCFKLYILARPISPYDIYSLKALFLILNNWQLLILLSPPILCIVLFIYNFKLNFQTVPKFIYPVLILFLLIMLFPKMILKSMDYSYGNFSYFQKSNYERRGPVIHLLQESIRFFINFQNIPNHQIVHESIDLLNNKITRQSSPVTTISAKRNIYFIMIESLVDPLQFNDFTFSSDPLDTDFRNLWKSSKYSNALSPVYAGETAQSEFEVLTGIPSGILGEEFILFEYGLNHNIPSLPKTLNNLGYSTISFHANVGEFWNRKNAYSRLGIKKHYFIDDFNLDDMDGSYLSDKSFLNQVLNKLNNEEEPYFAHILTISIHYPYPLNQEIRPNVISVKPQNSIMEKYVNSLYYTTTALSQFINTIQRIDPNGLIMISGDHMPYLGIDIENRFINNKNNFDQTSYEYIRHRIPLIIIDGLSNYTSGDIHLYEIPSTILNLLNIEQPNIMKLFNADEKYKIRYLDAWNKNLVIYNNGNKILYTKEQKNLPLYNEIRSIYLGHKTIIEDLLIGNQYLLDCIESNCNLSNK